MYVTPSKLIKSILPFKYVNVTKSPFSPYLIVKMLSNLSYEYVINKTLFK